MNDRIRKAVLAPIPPNYWSCCTDGSMGWHSYEGSCVAKKHAQRAHLTEEVHALRNALALREFVLPNLAILFWMAEHAQDFEGIDWKFDVEDMR